ncbi:DUF1900-domain-containing protein [Tilletiopsis washingtonensis]|uniref:Coronin n=1 Tax=Tilletiopsis washingtonensis TaxID=58919 RepID=A0A316Z9E8_9BASI|nr:DUF1900-domain-containing protein [Tilletiopsis washingtonensis]PWN97572.1 DUF1900-domain-containing protein [Tilletiopsis washingtonensis]
MSRFVRPSKYRHVYGTAARKEDFYDNIKVSNNAWDTNLVAGNGRFVSVNWAASGGGAFALIPVARTGKLPDIYPLCRGHSASVLDTAFSPFDDAFVASASDDGTVGLWRANEEDWSVLDLSEKEREKAGGVKDLQPLRKLHGGGRKVGQVLFHPVANHVLAAATGDHVIKLYDVEAGGDGAQVEMTGFSDSIQSLAFDWTGTTLVATCRDRKLRTFDTRKGGKAVQEAESHGGIKGARVAWCGQLDRFITTGFSKMSDRQLFLWDSTNISKPLKQIVLDSSSGVIMPFWSDNNICFLAGKGDGNIRYYELENDELHYLTEYKSTEPQRGLTFVPRRALNADENEIARAYKVTGNMVQPISFLVPRRAESFQSDIFPPAPSSKPALSAAEFFAGKTAQPNLVSLEDGSGVKSSGAAPSAASAGAPRSAPAPASAPAATASFASAPSNSTSAAAAPAPASAAAAPAAQPAPAPAPKAPEPATQQRAASPQKSTFAALRENGHAASAAAASAPASAAAASGAGDAEARKELEKLKRQLAERDARIRELEVENERLRTNQQRVREALM